MSGIIHAETRSRTGRTALVTLCVAAPIAALLWWLSGAGEPALQPIATVALADPSPMPAHQAAQEPDATTTAATPAAISTPAPSPAGGEIVERNAMVDPRLLSANRPNAARAFLNEVHLQPSPQGGFIVAEVLPESRYERLGLRPGDRIYTLDTPKMAAIDDSSMIALTQQSEIELEVYRNGTLTRLHYHYGSQSEESNEQRSEEKAHDHPR